MQECSKHRLHTASLQSDVGSIAVREAQAAPYSLLFYKNRASVAEAIAKGEGGGGQEQRRGKDTWHCPSCWRPLRPPQGQVTPQPKHL